MRKSLPLIISMFIGLSPIYANEQLAIQVQNQKIYLIKCMSGTFNMGSPKNELGRNNQSEHIQFKTNIDKDFYISKFETTQALYKAVVGTNPSKNIGDRNPVERVSFYDALNFCKRLNELTENTRPAGFVFTLPTEKQWEYACRAGLNTSLNNGKQISKIKGKNDELEDISWYKSNSNTQTHAVGSKKPNSWGIYDMHGNVAEWCLDSFNGTNTAKTINNNSKCVIRGGAYFYEPEKLRSASRGANPPNSVSSGFGFRVALVSDESYKTPQIDKAILEQINNAPLTQAVIKEEELEKEKDKDIIQQKEDEKNSLPRLILQTEETKTAEKTIPEIKENKTTVIKPNNSENRNNFVPIASQTTTKPAITLTNNDNAAKPQEVTPKIEKSTEEAKNNIKEIKNNTKELVIKAGEKISISINGVKFPLIGCPAGEYVMGSPNNEIGRSDNENQHKVIIDKGFYIGKYEITQGQYVKIMGNNPSISIGDKLPVHNINFFDAQNFCIKLNELTKDKRPANYEFAIPTEEQWEYACRSTHLTSLNNGKDLQNADSIDNELNKIGWYKINACEKVQTVGKRTANAWGLHDMLGNVWEWCKISNSSDQTKAIIRGGSFKSKASDCRNANRKEVEPSKTKEDYGFRIILKAKN